MASRRIEQVAGDLLDQQLIVRHIGIEGANQIIAVRVGVGNLEVVLVPVGFGEARQVEPMPGLSLAVMRRSQQSIDDAFIGLRRIVADEIFDFGRLWRHADQIERHAAQPGVLFGRWRRMQPARFRARQE